MISWPLGQNRPKSEPQTASHIHTLNGSRARIVNQITHTTHGPQNENLQRWMQVLGKNVGASPSNMLKNKRGFL